MDKKELLLKALKAGNGIVRLAPAWVPRVFQTPGRRLKLDPRDLYALGAERGGIDERWLASTTQADNGPGTPHDEGLSYVAVEEGCAVEKILLAEAIELLGDLFLGPEQMSRSGGWDVLTKFFDNMEPIPHHVHLMNEHARHVGRSSKPEAYYFPPQLNSLENHFPYTFFGLRPGTTKDHVKACLANWNKGDNGILDLSPAYRLRPGTGWDVPAGILHAPGTLVTYEPQRASDVFAMFQSMVEGNFVPRELLTKDVPQERHGDLDYLVSILDWEKNLDPNFVEKRFCPPKVISEGDHEKYVEKWVAYRSECFSAKELTVRPGASVCVRDAAAYGAILVQGYGTMETLEMETPTLIRYGQLTRDECFVTWERARDGVKITNRSEVEDLVMLKHFASGNPEVPIE